MARIINDPRKRAEFPGFGNVVNDICRGQYVLVLGSDVILDKNNNVEADGDSTKYFLNRIMHSKHEEGYSYHISGTFSDLILKNALKTTEVRRWLFDEIATTEFDREDLTPDLLRLLETKCFRLVLTTIFDPSVEKLMDEVWGKDKYRKMSIFNNRSQKFDF